MMWLYTIQYKAPTSWLTAVVQWSYNCPISVRAISMQKLILPGLRFRGGFSFSENDWAAKFTKCVGENIAKFAPSGPLTSQIDQVIFNFSILI